MKQWQSDRENPDNKIAREKRMSDNAKRIGMKTMKRIIPIAALAKMHSIELSRILK